MNALVPIVNMKGGIGKTTIAVSLAEASAALGKKTLLIDLDLQINASMTLVGNSEDHLVPWHRHQTIEDYLENRWQRNNPSPHIYFLRFGEVWILCGSPSLALFERRLLVACNNVHDCRLILASWMADLLAEARNQFDLIICDTPPGLSLLSETVIRAADHIIAPQVPDRLSTQGLQLYARYLQEHLQMPRVAERTYVFINRYSAGQTVSKLYADRIAKAAGHSSFPYKLFRNRYTSTTLFQRAMDRSDFNNPHNLTLDQLWYGVADQVIAATQELWQILGWMHDDDSEQPRGAFEAGFSAQHHLGQG
jgi:cellulose biosynthesis protein BcsQ